MPITKHSKVWYTNEDGFEFRFEPLDGTLTIMKRPFGFEARYLVHDEDPISPNHYDDTKLFLVHYHRDFHVTNDPIIREDDVRRWYRDEGEIEQARTYHFFPVAAYIHSGVVLSLGDGRHFPDARWDVSRVGVVLASKAKWPDEAKARTSAESLITEWNSYLSGDVYCLVKETYDQAKRPKDWDIVGGYVGAESAKQSLKTEI